MKKIVLIDDDNAFRNITAEILKMAGYDVEVAPNGKIGLELIYRLLPDLILCDINMPLLDGFGVMKIVAKDPQTSNIPIIFISSINDLSIIRQSMSLGADDFLVKPFQPSELITAIEKRLEKVNAWKQNNVHAEKKAFSRKNGKINIDDFFKNRKEKYLKKRDKLYFESDFATNVYYLNEGKVKALKTDSYGKEYVTDIYLPGSIFGYLPLKENAEHNETAVAMESSVLTVVPKHEFLNFIKSDAPLTFGILELLSENVAEKEDRMLQLAYATVKERVAGTLLKFQQDSEMNLSALSGISRDDLASIVGTTKESLVRTLAEFKKDGSIKTFGKTIQINNESVLRRNSSFFAH